jgi:hypothetical protein
MPPAVLASPLLAAGVTALGVVGGGALQSRASNKATKASSVANQQALAYTKEQDAAEKVRAARAEELYQRQWEAWQAQRMALARHLGLDVSGWEAGTPMRSAAPIAGAPMGPGRDPRLGNALMQGATLADIMNRGGPQGGGDWSDWGNYGLRQA